MARTTLWPPEHPPSIRPEYRLYAETAYTMPRPPKFATAEEAQAARRERNRINMANKRAGSIPMKGPEPRWIAYAPTPSDVPTITPPNLELRSNLVGNPQQIPTPPCTQSQDVPPLVLQPPAFHLRDEEDNMRAEQSNAQSQTIPGSTMTLIKRSRTPKTTSPKKKPTTPS
jgi:hypothetical protein